MESAQKMTGQGVRDLNHQGPKKKPEPPATVAGGTPTDEPADAVVPEAIPATDAVAVVDNG
jgi:hypothetical protein